MDILFSEKQKIDFIWPLSILAGVLVFNWWLYFRYGYNDLTFFYFCLIFVGMLSLLLGIMRMESEITRSEIRYKFFPFSPKWKSIPLSTISNVEIRTYRVFKEFGGRGKRSKKGQRAITFAGNQGLQIHFKSKNDTPLLLGTLKPEALKEVIDQLKLN